MEGLFNRRERKDRKRGFGGRLSLESWHLGVCGNLFILALGKQGVEDECGRRLSWVKINEQKTLYSKGTSVKNLILTFEPEKVFSFGPGKLTIEYGYDIIARTASYDGGGPSAFRMIYSEGEDSVGIASFKDLLSFARSRGIAIESEVAADIEAWMGLIFSVHQMQNPSRKMFGPGLIRKTTQKFRKEHLATFGIIYDDWLPLVMKDSLIFFATDTVAGGKKVVLKYVCDLKTFQVESMMILGQTK
jgi:hypothetical protein